MASSIGRLFRVTTWGESHGGAVGVVVDGCPPRLPLAESDIQPFLDRRRPGQSGLTTQRQEIDRVRILSGLFEGRALGTPISMLVENKDADPSAYEPIRNLYRPSHADYTYEAKYGIRDWQGGGRASARETVGRVAAGAIAEKILNLALGIEVVGWVAQIADLTADVDPASVSRGDVDAHPTRCPVPDVAAAMAERIEAVRRDGDSLGGVVGLVARNVPPGLGEPVFDKLEADLAGAMLSIPAAKGFEIGSGFQGTQLTGSQHNDPFQVQDGKVRTLSNHSGGIQGGISNGETIDLRVAFKPTATILKEQETIDEAGHPRKLAAAGRHDPCVVPRAVVIVEAMAAIVLADHWLRQLALSTAADHLEGGLA